MILHLALFSWRPGVTEEQVSALRQALEDMATQIPEIREYTCGPALRILDGGADFAVAAVIEKPEDLAVYLGHPLHEAVQRDLIPDMVAERRAIQLPLPERQPQI